MIFKGCRKTGKVDLEAVEMAVRGAMHRAGADALGRLLCDEESSAQVPCGCGSQARWHSLRSRQLLTVLGKVKFA